MSLDHPSIEEYHEIVSTYHKQTASLLRPPLWGVDSRLELDDFFKAVQAAKEKKRQDDTSGGSAKAAGSTYNKSSSGGGLLAARQHAELLRVRMHTTKGEREALIEDGARPNPNPNPNPKPHINWRRSLKMVLGLHSSEAA